MHFRRGLILLALAPSLALAAPKSGHKKPKKATTKAADTDPTTSLDAPADPKDAKEDAVKDARPAAPVTTPGPAASAATGGGGGGAAAGSGASGGAGDAKPADNDNPKSNDPDVDSLRQEYLSLRDELFKSRARANAVASALYSTRIQIKLTYTTARYYNPAKSSIRLDGANVFEDATGAIAGDDGTRFDGYLAPGRHLITFHVEAIGKDDDTFTSTTETQIVVKAIAGKDLVVAAKAHDGGDIAYEWKKSEHGSYGLGVDVSVKTLARTPSDESAAKAKK